MEMIVEQAVFNVKNYEYKFFVEDRIAFIGKANRTVIPTPRKIFLYDNAGNELYSLKQENLFRFVIANIPLIGFALGKDCPYNFNVKGIKHGAFVQKYFNFSGLIIGTIGVNTYSLHGHSGNTVSIFCGEKQVGLIQRNAVKTGDADKYKVLFSSSSIGRELVASLTILSDVVWHTTDRSTTLLSWEYSVQLGGRKQDKSWIPED